MNKKAKNIRKIYFPDVYFCDNRTTNSFIKIIKHFTSESNYYFYLHRELGEYLTKDELTRYRMEIPKFFNSNGLFVDKTIEKFKEKRNSTFDPRISAIGMLTMNKKTYDMLPNICNYYRETTFFKFFSEFAWEKYVNEYDRYKMQGLEIFIALGYTDCVITYSEGLRICLDMERYNLNSIVNGLNILGYTLKNTNSNEWFQAILRKDYELNKHD